MPDGISEHEALNRIIGMLDGPEQKKIQGAVRAFLRERQPTFFASERAAGRPSPGDLFGAAPEEGDSLRIALQIRLGLSKGQNIADLIIVTLSD